jgi:hypothetical protein
VPEKVKIKEGSDGLLRVERKGRLRGWVIAGVVLGLVFAVVVSKGDLTERTTRAKEAARIGHYDEAWQHLQLRPVTRSVRSDRQCAQRSSGQVRQLFASTPCRSLKRALLVVGTGADTIAVSVAWVQMSSTKDAAQLKQILDKNDMGDIYPISGRVLKLGDIRFTRKHYSSQQSETMVVIAEAEPVRGYPAANLLDAITQVAVALPPL